ncbi:MAG TPA: DMT family transporter, partial [Bordetella sp.]
MMKREKYELLALAAVWGGSFICLRIAAPEFGPSALMFLRVGLAVLVVLPVTVMRGGDLMLAARRWRPLLLVGAFNMAFPFLAYAYAGKVLGAG